MSTISSMRISDKSQPTEEKLHQSIYSSQENQAKELILSQLDQVEPRPRNPSLSFVVMLKVKVKKKQHQ